MQRVVRGSAGGRNQSDFTLSKRRQSRHRLAVAVVGTMASLTILPAAFAATSDIFTNGAGSNTWENPANWSTSALPNSGVNAVIDGGNTVNATSPTDVSLWLVVGAAPNSFSFGGNGGTGVLNINTGGTVTSSNSPLLLGNGSSTGTGNYSGVINVNAGGTLVQNGGFGVYIGYNQSHDVPDPNTTGTLNVNGGICNFVNANPLWIGANNDNAATETGILNLGLNNSSGSVNAYSVQVGDGNSLGVLNVSSGIFTSSYYLTTGNGASGGHGIINVTGGTVILSQLTVGEVTPLLCVFNESGGTATVSSSMYVARGTGTLGEMNLTGGNFTLTAGNDFAIAQATNSVGILNISGTANFTLNNGIFGLAMGKGTGSTTIVNQSGGSATISASSNLGLFFANANNATVTYNLTGGTLTVPEISAFGGSTNNPQTLILNGGTLIANNSMTVPEISGSHTVTFTAPTNFTTVIGPAGFNFNAGSFTTTWNNSLTGSAADGGIYKTGPGTLILAGSNTFTGPINISSGAIDASTPASLPGYQTANHIVIATGATLALAVGGTGQFQATDVTNITATQAFQTGSFVGVDTTAGNVTISTTLTDAPSGSLGLVKLGSNTLYLSGSNTYTGGTNIAGGTVSLQSTGALGSTGPVVFGKGTPYLQFTSTNTTDYSPRFTTAANQSYGIDTNGQNITFAGPINSSGGYLNKIGGGTLQLNASGNSTLGFQVNGGTLELEGTYTTTGGNNYLYVGNGGSAGGSNGDMGTLILDNGAVLNVTGQYADAFVIARDSGSGTVIQNAGSTIIFNPSPATPLIVDASSSTNSTGIYQLSGGSLNMSGNTLEVGLLAGNGTLTIAPGSAISNIGKFIVATNGGTETGTVMQTGGMVSINTSNALIISNGTADTGIYTIMGGTLSTPAINSFGGATTYPGSSTLNLDGGTIQATMDAPSFINGIGSAVVMDYATTIDNNSHNITINQQLTHGGSSTPDGGLIFIGSGTTKLLGANSYTGNTLIQGGTVTAANTTALGLGSVILSGGGTLALTKIPASIVSLGSFQANGIGNFTPVASGNSAQMSSPLTGEQSSLLSGNTITVSDTAGFSASFIYSHAKITGGADGVTFVLLQSGNGNTQVGGGGGADGYVGAGGQFDPTANGGSDSIAADVDEYNSQIGIGINGAWSNQSGGGSIPFIQTTGALTVDITYSYNANAGSGTYAETLTSLSNGSSYTFSKSGIDLAQLLGGTAGGTATVYFGFTGSTGGVVDSQYVSNLSISNGSGGVPVTGLTIANPVSVADGSTGAIQLAPTPNYSTGTVGPITIGNGSKLTLSIGTAPAVGVVRGALTTPSITFSNASSGQLDIGGNAVDITGGVQSLASVTALVASGYAHGQWTGQGIVSGAAASDSTHLTAVGIIQNNQSGTALYTSFDGSTPGAGDILLKVTYYGDTNLDGKVDGTDYTRIDNGFRTHATGWFNGDFNYDGVIDGSDYALIDNSYNTQGAQLASEVASPTAQIAGGGSSAVPEPTAIGLLGIGAVALLGRRKRRSSIR